jgi:hypothetical protein
MTLRQRHRMISSATPCPSSFRIGQGRSLGAVHASRDGIAPNSSAVTVADWTKGNCLYTVLATNWRHAWRARYQLTVASTLPRRPRAVDVDATLDWT